MVRALNHRASTQIICSFLTFKGFSCSLLWGVLTCIWKCGFFCAEGSPTSLVAHAPHFTQCISSNIHQTSTVNTWCWRTGFHPEKINTPNQTHSTLKTLINPHHRLKLYRNAKSHCPILCLEKLGQATFFKASQGQRAEADSKGSGGPCRWEGRWPGPAASLDALRQTPCGYLPRTPFTHQLLFFPPKVTMMPSSPVSNCPLIYLLTSI